MAEEQKPVTLAPATEAVAETKVEETPVVPVVATEAAPVTTETAAAPVTEAAPAVEETPVAATEEAAKTEEVTPVEEGHLEHKGSNFPKNFLYSKKFFWFGAEPVDTKSISTFKADKAADVAHHVHAWAAETGKGLLFFSEKADKATPHGAIQLAESSEPIVEGTNKFHFSAKGHKHTFKASSTAERDNWVSQLKVKIIEAKELATTITESETYKKTLESFKPKKEETPVAAVAAEPTTTEAVATEETPAEAEAVVPVVPVVEEPKKEEVKKEEPKRRSASRKRGSIFGTSLFGKKEEKPTEAAAETKAAETEVPAAETAVVAAEEAPAAETTAVVATEPAPEVTPAEVPVVVDETKAEEPKAEEKPVKATATKRGSIFSNLSFGKKRATSPQPTAAPVEETPANTTEAVAENAPVIPAVETTEPLSAEVSSPANVPTETVDATPATNGEAAAAKEVKSEKRKSSLPFGFGKKDKATTSDDEEKVKSPSPFAKIRATIKSKATPKAAEKPAETAAEDKPVEAEPTTTEAIKEEETAPVAEPEVPVVEEAAPAEKPLAATPVISTAA